MELYCDGKVRAKYSQQEYQEAAHELSRHNIYLLQPICFRADKYP